jgi:hypothetical protein
MEAGGDYGHQLQDSSDRPHLHGFQAPEELKTDST